MIIDITGIELTPGNQGLNCKGNGSFINEFGNLLECCCDECDYMMCCTNEHNSFECLTCFDENCPNAKKIKENY